MPRKAGARLPIIHQGLSQAAAPAHPFSTAVDAQQNRPEHRFGPCRYGAAERLPLLPWNLLPHNSTSVVQPFGPGLLPPAPHHRSFPARTPHLALPGAASGNPPSPLGPRTGKPIPDRSPRPSPPGPAPALGADNKSSWHWRFSKDKRDGGGYDVATYGRKAVALGPQPFTPLIPAITLTP